ncbi:kxDL motif-containing protein CG10681 [Haematobia irritans]|uniref:kxDL motif-containing protein CG10681 n=1 Tax=Haematobia irritans TaxID=7368 RepID=UPI003F500433
MQNVTMNEDENDLSEFTAAEAFIQSIAGFVNQSDVENMIRGQKQMLQRFEKTNEMLLNCNALSLSRLKQSDLDFKRHCKVLADMKKDLDYIFRKIKSIKQKLSQQYPNAYASSIQPQRSSLAEEAEDETEPQTSFDKEKNCEKSQTKSSQIEYVQMEEAIDDNGKPLENELIKKVCSIETNNPNDSSDCTSEDTG